jgi:serine/threonine-protein phosphatase PGAM5
MRISKRQNGALVTAPCRVEDKRTGHRRRSSKSRYTALRSIAFSLILACLTGPQVRAVESAETHFTRTLFLVRHGAYDTAAKTDPAAGPGLTPLGIAQARLIAARLRGLPTRLDSLTSSTMTRARETAVVMRETLTDIPIQQTALLSECTPPIVRANGTEERDAKKAAECAKRLDEAFNQYFVPASGSPRSDVLVCHGNVIRYFVMKAMGVTTTTWIRMSVAHASLTVIQVTPNGELRILSIGDVGHLPPNLQSGTAEFDPQLVIPNMISVQ